MKSVKNLTRWMFPDENASGGYNGSNTGNFHPKATGDVNSSTVSKDGKPEVLETITSKGEITVYDEEMNVGVVEGRYRFDIQKFSHLRLRARLPISYTVIKSGNSFDWEVVEISVQYDSDKPQTNATLKPNVSSSRNTPSEEKQVVQVLKSENRPPSEVRNDVNSSSTNQDTVEEDLPEIPEYTPFAIATIQPAKHPLPSQRKIANLRTLVCKASYMQPDCLWVHHPTCSEKLKIDKGLFGPADFVLVGDWLTVCIENQTDEDSSPPTVVSVQWTEKGTIIGQIGQKSGFYCVKDVYIPEKELRKRGMNLKVGDMCKVSYVLSDQQKFQKDGLTKAFFTKRSCVVDTVTESEISNFEEDSAFAKYSRAVENLCRNKHQVVISPETVNFGSFKVNDIVKKPIEIMNQGYQPVTLRNIKLQGDQTVCEFSFEVAKPEGGGILKFIDPGSSLTVLIVAAPKLLGKTQEICIFDFGNFYIGRKVNIRGISDNSEVLGTIKSTRPPGRKARGQKIREEERRLKKMLEENKATLVPGPAAIRSPFFLPSFLPSYKVPDKLEIIYMEEIQFEGKGSELMEKEYPDVDWTNLTFDNYLTRFHTCLWLEELETLKIRKDLDLTDISLTVDQDLVFFHVPYLSETKPVLNVGERVRCYYTNISDETEAEVLADDGNDSDSGEEEKSKHVVHDGYIHAIHGQNVYARFEKFHRTYNNSTVNVTFKQRRTNNKRQHHALEMARNCLGENFLFPLEGILDIKPPKIQFVETSSTDQAHNQPRTPEVQLQQLHVSAEDKTKRYQKLPPRQMTDFRAANIFKNTQRPPQNDMIKGATLSWFNTHLNPEQKDAVRRILRGQCRPLPYVIFGPPGTGKSVTVVEAVMQINKIDKLSRILVAVPSNQAADLIAERLAMSEQYIPGDFVRFNGFMRSGQPVPDSISEYCSIGENLNCVIRHKIIISTISTAGQFFQLGLAPDHFSHVFIDEAGYATEPETLIACVLAATAKDGQIILSGDPNQLMPVLHHKSEVHKLLRRSLLERFMSTSVYAPNTEKFAEKYNPVYITMLTRSYRLPEVLLDLPSKRFYNGNLVSNAPTDYTLLKKLNFLVNDEIPLMFHGIIGRSQHSGSPSWCNVEEICQCMRYVNDLKQAGVKSENIGIISLYRKQVDILKMELVKMYSSSSEEPPKVATIHEFQGGERKIIIITTVLSMHSEVLKNFSSSNVFILSSKMFNVAITRAKSLLLVIGDPHTLHYSNDWLAMIKYCVDLGVYIGCQLPSVLKPIAQPSLQPHLFSEPDGSGEMSSQAQSDIAGNWEQFNGYNDNQNNGEVDDEFSSDDEEGYGTEIGAVSRFN